MKAASPAVEPEDLADIDGFCDALWLEDGLARATLASYRSDLAHLAVWLRGEGHGRLLDASEAALIAYIARLAREKRASSQARHLSTLRRFYRWQRARGRLFADPTLKLAHPVRPARLPKVLSEKQVEALLADVAGADQLHVLAGVDRLRVTHAPPADADDADA